MSKKNSIDHLEEVENQSGNDRGMDNIYELTEREHSMTLMQGLKLYNKAVIWSVVVSLTIVMDGYNITLLGSLFGFPSFKKQFGDRLEDGSYDLSASWQTALSMMNSVGNIFGIMLGSWTVDIFGHKRLMQVCFLLITGFTFILVFANTKVVLLIGQLLIGFPNGVFGVMGPMYASEVCPVVLRGYLTTYTNICFIIGQLISQCVLKGCSERDFSWSFRVPFAIQWFWPVVLFIPICFAPNSPWWLVRRGRNEAAEEAYKKLMSEDSNIDAKAAVHFIKETTKMEKEYQKSATYLDCFKGVDLRRTEISAIGLMIQSVTLGNVMTFAVYFFQQAGISESNSFTLGIVQYAIGFVGTLISWVLMMKDFGRRKIYLYGIVIIAINFLIMGFVSLAPESNLAVKWVVAVMLFLAVFFYDISVGPVAFALISEISSTRLRAKTIGLSRNLFHVWSIVNSIIYPYMLNSTAGNWKGKVGFFQAGLNVVAFIWAFFRLPEPAGRTYEELNIMFIRRVKARDFKDYQIDTLDVDAIIANDLNKQITKEI